MCSFVIIIGSEEITGKKDSTESHFPEKCSFMCILASSTLTDLFTRLFSRELNTKELQAVHARRNQLEKLCKADGQHQVDNVLKTLDRGMQECNAFRKHQTQLGALCRQLTSSGLHIVGTYLLPI